jgi:Thioesterase-like superfamily
MAPEPLFRSDGDRYVPSELTRSPWGPDSLHGGSFGALLAGVIERHEVDVPVHVARTTFEIVRPVPYEPLRVATRTVRPGKKVQLVESVLSVAATDVEVCRAVALRIRLADVELPTTPVDDPPPVLPSTSPDGILGDNWRAFHNEGVEMRWAEGRFEEQGPAVVWIRLPRPVVDDEEPSPVQRVMAAADFGNGVSHVLPFGQYLFINPDLTVYLHRPPVGEWICLDARTHLSTVGTGMAESALSDEHGRLGRSVQALLVDRLS